MDAMTSSVVAEVGTGGPPAQAERSGGIGAGRAYALLLVITGLAGLLAAWVITLDKNRILEYEAEGKLYTPSCSLNPVVSCGSVMNSDQAEAFGFPNTMLGLVTFGMVIAIGMGLLAGARYHRWFWAGLQAGTLFGAGFCSWLQYQSLYNINALCLWCCLVWVAVIFMFWYTTCHNVRQGVLPASPGVKQVVEEFHWFFPALHVAVIGVLILIRWWDFWTG